MFSKVHSTERENTSEKMDHISFVTWSVIENPTFEFLLYIRHVRKLKNYIFVVHFFLQMGKKSELCASKLRYF